MEKIERQIDEKRKAKVEWDDYGCHLHTMNNGYQWSGAAIYSIEVAIMARDILDEYIRLNATPNEMEGE